MNSRRTKPGRPGLSASPAVWARKLGGRGRPTGRIKRNRQALARDPGGCRETRGETGEKLSRLTEYLALARGPGGPVIVCRCGLSVCAASENYKEHLAVRELVRRAEVGSLEERERVPSFSLKEFYCPGCWTLVETEVSVAQTEP